MESPNPVHPATLEEVPTSELVSQTLREARELIELEMTLAKQEVREELQRAKRAAMIGGLALACGIWAIAVLLVALILALGGTALHALIVGAVLLAVCGGAAAYAYSALPKAPLEETRARLKDDVNRLKEHAA